MFIYFNHQKNNINKNLIIFRKLLKNYKIKYNKPTYIKLKLKLIIKYLKRINRNVFFFFKYLL